MERLSYFVRRLLLMIPTFLGITFVCFALCHFVPGGPVEQALMQLRGETAGEGGVAGTGGMTAVSESYRETLMREFGFDRPMHERYWDWLVTKRMGMRMESYRYPPDTAWEVIRERFPVSLWFGITSFMLTYLVCIPLGISKAVRNGSAFDAVSSAVVFACYAIPPYALGMVLKTLFCGTVDGLWDIFPVAGFRSDDFAALSPLQQVLDIARHMVLPLICYVIGNFAFLTVLMKNSLLEQISSDYVRTVIARGGTFRRAVWGHAFRNALIPIATGFGGILSILFAGSVLIEHIFEIPGMGQLGFEAIVGRDYAVFMGVLALTSILAMLGNLLSDFCYILIDPRIHFRR